jgi:hypothetical protein
MSAVLTLALARIRRRPGRFAFAALGLAVAIAFGGAVLVEGTISGDRAAHKVLAQASALDRSVRVDWSGPASSAVGAQARRTLADLGLPTQAQVVLLSPLRLGGVVVRMVAVSPLARWVYGAPNLGPCRPANCPMLLAGGQLTLRSLTAPGVRVSILRSARLRSAAPLGFAPAAGDPPVLITGDLPGLNRLPALGGIVHTSSWLSVLLGSQLHSWSLAALERGLRREQLRLTGAANNFNFTAPFDAIDQARTRASAGPRGLLLAGGGALAALAVFVVLAGAALRMDMRSELGRLGVAGARAVECTVLALLEAGWIAATAAVAGSAAAVGLGALLAVAAGEPAGGVIDHSLLTLAGGAGAAGAFVSSTVLIAALIGLPRRVLVALADALAIGALTALVVALALGVSTTASALLVAPLACLTAGLLLIRGVSVALRFGERLARRAPPLARVAALGLARGPGLPSVAVAFIAISVGLGGFALCYRATLQRSASDQAADRVPLDALVAPGSDFLTPLQLAPLASWRSLAGGRVLPVRRTDGSYLDGGQTVTVPTLGIPADGLALIHGWRASDASAPLPTLARRLVPRGPVRFPGAMLRPGTRRIVVDARAREATDVDAELRSPDGSVDDVRLGEAVPARRVLSAAIPTGRWELEALELNLPSGVAATNAHQGGEGAAPPSTGSGPVNLGAPTALDGRGRELAVLRLDAWKGFGAAGGGRPAPGGGLVVQFVQSGDSGVLRPAQPSDRRPLPVLVDPRTAAAAGPGGALPLSIDGLPVRAHVVGVLRRFPTLPSDAAGFIVADEAVLTATLDALQPGQGRPDELWISTAHLGRLREALAGVRFAPLQSSFRADVERSLSGDPVARGVLGTLIAAAAVALALALAGLQAVVLGAARNARLEGDLAGLGVGPRGLRAELRFRLATAAVSGVAAGIAVAVLLTGLAVAGVGSTLGTSRPSVIAVVPLGALALWIVVALGGLSLIGWLATSSPRRSA